MGDICANQAFNCQEKVYGLQFHLEVNASLINRWINLPVHQSELGCSAEQINSREARINVETEQYLNRSLNLSETVFNQFLDLLPSVKGRHVFQTR